LILILEEGEPFRFPSLFISDQVDVSRLAVLGEDSYDVAFGALEGEAADVDVGCVAVVSMPGGGWGTADLLA